MPIVRSASSTTTFDKRFLQISLLFAFLSALWPLLEKPFNPTPAIIDDLSTSKVAHFSELFYFLCQELFL